MITLSNNNCRTKGSYTIIRADKCKVTMLSSPKEAVYKDKARLMPDLKGLHSLNCSTIRITRELLGNMNMNIIMKQLITNM